MEDLVFQDDGGEANDADDNDGSHETITKSHRQLASNFSSFDTDSFVRSSRELSTWTADQGDVTSVMYQCSGSGEFEIAPPEQQIHPDAGIFFNQNGCQPKICRTPPSTENVVSNDVDKCIGIKFGEKCTIRCKSNYRDKRNAEGNREFTCGADGLFEGDYDGSLLCERSTCEGPVRERREILEWATRETGRYSASCADLESMSYGQFCPVLCNNDFEVDPTIDGAGEATCETVEQRVDFSPAPVCRPKQCGATPTVQYAVATPTQCETLFHAHECGGPEFPVSCKAGYVPCGKFQCMYGSYVETPVCVKSCGDPNTFEMALG